MVQRWVECPPSHLRRNDDHQAAAVTEHEGGGDATQPPAHSPGRARDPWPVAGRHPRAGRTLTAHYGVALARRLAAVMKDRSLSDRAVARLSGMSHNTIGRIARGEVLPDLGTVARLEVALQTSLWPSALWHTFTPDASGGTPAQP